MRKYVSFIAPVVFYFCVAMLGKIFTSQGITDWYPALNKPSFTPPGSFIGVMWTLIYILSAISLILFAQSAYRKPLFWTIVGLYVINGFLNAAWSHIFFSAHLLGLAVIDAALIGLTVALMMVSIWKYSKVSAILLLPYLLWVCFAIFLSYKIYQLNT